MRTTACLCAILLLAGCSLHRPQTVPLPVDPPAAYTEAEETQSPPLPGRWWESFDDPRLDRLMEATFAHNLELEQGFARLAQAEAALRATQASQLPFLNFSAEAGRSSQPNFIDQSTGNNYNLAVAAGYEVDIWRKLASATEAAALQHRASNRELRTLYLSLSARAADLYYLAIEQRAQLALTDRTIAGFADTLKRVERRYREGLVPALDIYQARQNLASAKARRPVFEATLATTEHALAVLTGRYPARHPDASLTRLPEVPEIFPAGLPSQLLARRPDVEAALLGVKAADEQVAVALADRFPAIDLLASYGSSRSAFTTGVIKGDFWNLAASLVQPLFDGGRRRAEVERRRAVVKEAVARYQQEVLEAFGEVEDALVNNRRTEEQIVRLAENEEASGSALRLALERYTQGLTDYLPVLNAQILHFDAQSRLLAARRQLISHRISLARALGGRWMQQEVEERLAANEQTE